MRKIPRAIKEFRILTSILENGNHAGIRDTAKRLDLAPSTVHRILSTLQENGYVKRLSTGKYSVGIELVRLSMLVLQQFDRDALIHQALMRAVESTGETCVLNMATADYSQVFVMDMARSSHALQYRLKVGDCHQITAGASGQATLAFLPSDLQEEILDGGLTSYTSDTIQSRQLQLDRLHQVKQQGYALTKGEHIEGAVGIAVPIFSEKNGTQAIGNVSATIPQGRFQEEKTDFIVEDLKIAAEELSVLLATQFGDER